MPAAASSSSVIESGHPRATNGGDAGVAAGPPRRARRAWRLAWRGAALGCGTAGLFVLHVLGSVCLTGWSAARLRWRNRLFRLWSRMGCRVLGLRVEVRGEPPEGPFFLVSNHLSYVDVLVLASHLDASFVAKRDVRSWPIVGALCRSVGTIFVDRTSRRDVARVNRSIEATLRRGLGVVLFPEGTSTDGRQVAPFKTALLAYPAQHGWPVHWASLAYRTPPGEVPARLSVCWWGDMPFAPHVLDLLKLSGARAVVTHGAESVEDDDRKRLARALHARVSEALHPGAERAS